MATRLGQAFVELSAKTDKLQSDLAKAKTETSSSVQSMQSHMDSLTFNASSFLAASVAIAGTGLSIQALSRSMMSLIDTQSQFEAKIKAFQAITGGYGAAATQMDFVRQTSNRLGLELLTTADGFKTISAAAMGTSLQGKQTQEIFTAVATAARVLGLSNDQFSGTLLALGQMISKGKVQAEELRGQLGERLPGAFQIAAQAMNMTTGELDKFMAAGKLTAEDFLPKFATALQQRFGKDVPTASDTTTAALNRLGNAWTTFKSDFAEGSGVIIGFRALTGELTKMLRLLDEAPTRLKTFSEEWEKHDNRWRLFPDGGFFDAFGSATRAANLPLRQTAGVESYAGIGGGLESPAVRAPVKELIDEESRRLQDATVASKAWTAANQEASAALDAARTPLQLYNDQLQQYKTWANQGVINQQQLDALTGKAGETYKAALAKETIVPLSLDDITKTLVQFDLKQKVILQAMANDNDSYFAELADRSGDYYKAEEIRMWQNISNRQDAYDRNVTQWAEMYRQMQAEVGKYAVVDPRVSAKLTEAQQLLEDLTKNTPTIKAQIVTQEQDRRGYAVSLADASRVSDLAALNVEYVKLTGSLRDQYAAQMQLIDATGRRYALEHPGELAAAYTKIVNEQKRLLELQKSGSFLDGIIEGAQEIKRTLPTAFDIGRESILSLKQGIGDAADALATFCTTGKADFGSLAQSIIHDILRIQIQGLLMSSILGTASGGGIFSSLLGGIGSLLGFGSTTFTSAGGVSWTRGLNFPTHADGGNVYAGLPSIVGERGPEIFVPYTSGSIIPNHLLRSTSKDASRSGAKVVDFSPTIQVNLKDESGGVSNTSVSSQREGEKMILDVVLKGTRNNPGFRNNLVSVLSR